MLHVVRILLFLLVNAAGYLSILLLSNGAIKMGVYPDMLTLQDRDMFETWLFGGGLWVWIASAFVSIGSFFTIGTMRNVLLLAPLYMTGSYVTLVILYFYFMWQGA